jgi:chromosome segregation ATPase
MYTKSEHTKFWDPVDVLQMINPDRNGLTCVGYAPSCRRRCRNPINANNRNTAFGILDELSYINPEVTNIRSKLSTLAKTTLCLAYHQNQVDRMVKSWMNTISTLQGSFSVKQEYNQDEYKPRRGQFEAKTKEKKSEYGRNQKRETEYKQSERERLARLKAKLEKLEKEIQDKREQERLAQEKARHEKLEKAAREKRKQERLARERAMREKLEKAAQEKREKEEKLWAQAWGNYEESWVEFRGTYFSSILIR